MTDFKNVAIGLFIGITIIVGEYFYVSHLKDTEWKDKIALAPVDTTWHDLTPIPIPRPPQHMETEASPGKIPSTTPIPSGHPSVPVQNTPDEPRNFGEQLNTIHLFEYQMQLEALQKENSRLNQEVGATLFDSFGGKHTLGWSPTRQRFFEDYIPPNDTLFRRFGFATKTVVEEPTSYWSFNISFEYFKPIGAGTGAQLGYEPVFVGVTKFFDEKNLLYRVGAGWRF